MKHTSSPMSRPHFQKFERGRFAGEVRGDLLEALSAARLEGLREEVQTAREGVLARGRHQIVVLPFELGVEVVEVAVKAFGSQSGWKDRLDLKRGSKAARSFRAARFLTEHEVDTPAPLAFFEFWDGRRLVESYYFSVYCADLVSFKAEIRRIFEEGEPCDVLVGLLEKVGQAMKRMHDSGFYHRDLGSQNIELERGADGDWEKVNFIDLNRGRIRDGLSMKERALDFARLTLPSGFLGILVLIYWQAKAPPEFTKEMLKARKRFEWWVKSRRWRHPIKSRKKQRAATRRGHFQAKDIWVWDRRSAQAAITLDRPDRKKCQSKLNHFKVAGSVLAWAAGVCKEYRRQESGAFEREVRLKGRIGMALEPADLDFEPQLELLNELGKIPVLLRFGHHEGRAQWDKTLGYLERLHHDGHEVMVAILQDRRAVLEPDSWRGFLEVVFERIAGKVTMVEVCHAMNRVKWGVHNLKEYAALLAPVVDLKKRYPDLPISGPACIDFEYHYLVAALAGTPEGLHYDALSHHLYVDRRGAPENQQGAFGTVEKARLLKAVALHSKRCHDRVIVSEVNWPITGTGVWSPVSSSYLSPGAKGSKVHVSEESYGHYMVRYLTLTLCSGFVDQVFWWRLVAHGFGLVDERSAEGWRKRPAFAMLRTFLKELGEATFVERLGVGEEIYALRFKRDGGQVTLTWCNGCTHAGPWPVDFDHALDAFGNRIELVEVGESPVYLCH
ncbi:MAG: lipopolysaccharide kinase InaA family protein [Akkermansiaceae bacterium]